MGDHSPSLFSLESTGGIKKIKVSGRQVQHYKLMTERFSKCTKFSLEKCQTFSKVLHIMYLLIDRTKVKTSKDASSVKKTTSKFLVHSLLNEVNMLHRHCI